MKIKDIILLSYSPFTMNTLMRILLGKLF